MLAHDDYKHTWGDGFATRRRGALCLRARLMSDSQHAATAATVSAVRAAPLRPRAPPRACFPT